MSRAAQLNLEPLKRLILDHLDAARRDLSVAEITAGLRHEHPRSPAPLHIVAVRLALRELIGTGEVHGTRPGDRAGRGAPAWTYGTESEVPR